MGAVPQMQSQLRGWWTGTLFRAQLSSPPQAGQEWSARPLLEPSPWESRSGISSEAQAQPVQPQRPAPQEQQQQLVQQARALPSQPSQEAQSEGWRAEWWRRLARPSVAARWPPIRRQVERFWRATLQWLWFGHRHWRRGRQARARTSCSKLLRRLRLVLSAREPQVPGLAQAALPVVPPLLQGPQLLEAPRQRAAPVWREQLVSRAELVWPEEQPERRERARSSSRSLPRPGPHGPLPVNRNRPFALTGNPLPQGLLRRRPPTTSGYAYDNSYQRPVFHATGFRHAAGAENSLCHARGKG
jgi:hypothetical protein